MANINKDKKYHFIYKTTNLLNGRYYIGMHSTANLKDGYLGSGKKLLHSVKKYGKKNFKFEILEFFDSREELAEREKELVNESLLKDPMCLNLVLGGFGGFTKEIASLGGKSRTKKLAELLKTDIEFKKNYGEKIRTGLKKNYAVGTWWTGKKHRKDTIEKMKLLSQNRGQGNTNSQYGTCWITNGLESKKITKDSAIPEGWYKGRKQKTINVYCWITNGLESKIIKKDSPIPEGWHKGRTF